MFFESVFFHSAMLASRTSFEVEAFSDETSHTFTTSREIKWIISTGYHKLKPLKRIKNILIPGLSQKTLTPTLSEFEL